MSGLAKLVVAALVTCALASSAVILRAKDPAIEGRITLARLRWGSDLGSYGRGFSSRGITTGRAPSSTSR